MYKSVVKRRSSSQPGRPSNHESDRCSIKYDSKAASKYLKENEASLIPRPRSYVRSASADRLSFRYSMAKQKATTPNTPKLNARVPMAQSAVSKSMSKIQRPSSAMTRISSVQQRPSLQDQYRDRTSKGVTPRSVKSRNTIQPERLGRSPSAERAGVSVPKGPKKDTRPIQDKEFQAEMLSKINNYFYRHGLSTVLNSNGSIKPFTLKIFVDVTVMLLKTLSIEFKPGLTLQNYIDNVPKIAKIIHYPGLISKSWLKTANALHSFKEALAWISWLVEMCEVKEIAKETYRYDNLPLINQSNSDIGNALPRIIECYMAWNEEKFEEEKETHRTFVNEVKERKGYHPGKLEEATKKRDEAKQKLKVAQEKLSKVVDEEMELEDILRNLKVDQEKQNTHLLERERYSNKISKELVDMKETKALRLKKLADLKEKKETLLQTIKKQPMTVLQRDKIVIQCKERQNQIQTFEEVLENIRKDHYTLEIKLGNANNQLTKAVFEYNQFIFTRMSDYDSIDWKELQLPESSNREINFRDELKKTERLVSDLVKDFSEKNKKLQVSLEVLKREANLSLGRREDLVRKLDKKKKTLKAKEKDLKAAENTKLEKMTKLDSEIEELEEKLVNSRKEYSEVTDRLNEVIEKNAALERKITKMTESSEKTTSRLRAREESCKKKIANIIIKGTKI